MPFTLRRAALAALLVLALAAPGVARQRHPRPSPSPETSQGATILELNGPADPPETRRDRQPQAPVSGAEATFFVEPEAGIAPVIGAMEGARSSIDLVVYLLSDDRVVSALKRAQERGVKVRVLLEPHPYGGSGGNRKTFERLQRLGIAVRSTPSRFRFTHQKTILFDGRTALITTANFTRSAFSKNREYGYFDRDPAEVAEIAAMFQADWDDRPFVPRAERLVVSPTNSREKILALIRSARSSLWVQDETCSDPQVIAAIAERQRAGVQVTVQVAEVKDLPKIAAAGLSARKLARRYLHAKTIVVDHQRAYLGSENLTTNSLDRNRELGILVDDPAVIRTLERTVTADWAE